MRYLLAVLILVLTSVSAHAASDTFPASTSRPTVAQFLPSPTHTYYCSPSGNNTTGTGAIGSPWKDLIGASSGGAGTPVGPGDLIYFRGGSYPVYSRINTYYSQNVITINGTEANPIVITNYPGEIASWTDTTTTFSMSFDGDYIKVIGTMVGSDYGFRVIGGWSVNYADYLQISGVDFSAGVPNGDTNNSMFASIRHSLTASNSPVDYMVFSHNRLRDSAEIDGKMAALRLYESRYVTIEYNIFQDNTELGDGGSVYFKTEMYHAQVRYNKFINCEKGVSFVAGDNGMDFGFFGYPPQSVL